MRKYMNLFIVAKRAGNQELKYDAESTKEAEEKCLFQSTDSLRNEYGVAINIIKGGRAVHGRVKRDWKRERTTEYVREEKRKKSGVGFISCTVQNYE